MKRNLSAIALGLVLAYAAAPVMALEDIAVINQQSSYNTATVDQNTSTKADVYVYQGTYDYNKVILTQSGGVNYGNTSQTGYNNYALFEQGLAGSSSSNTAWLNQNGNNNDSRMWQTVSTSNGTNTTSGNVTQNGNSNVSSVYQH